MRYSQGGGLAINIENYLQNKIDDFGEKNTERMIHVYEDLLNERMKKIFSRIHFQINTLFKYLNERNSADRTPKHYTADSSRSLIYWIDQIEEIKNAVKKTPLAFEINQYYANQFIKCKEFLRNSGGSPIPDDFEKIEIISVEPIFTIINSTVVIGLDAEHIYPIKLIGGGSYAQVFKYKDEFYNKYFAIKRAKPDIVGKEYERFKLEFEEMKKLSSPYVVEVYRFDETKREYIMEFVDETLLDYINANNTKLSKEERKNIIMQILRAFDYLHSRGILHRDISLTNVLIKKYEGLNVIKISDFGLVKIVDSTITSTQTELKGSLNDPELEIYGFNNYNITHETYALTRLIFFVMSGRKNLAKFDSEKQELFVKKGISRKLDDRYQSIDELRKAYIEI